MKLCLLAFILAAGAVQAQKRDPKFFTVNLPRDNSKLENIRFLCSQYYDHDKCLNDTTALRKAVARYPVQLLGKWGYYLVAAEDWPQFAYSHGGNKCSVAFSALPGRITILDGSLISPTADRDVELLRCFAVSTGPVLLDLVVTHEMGHAICDEKDERRADDYGKQLRISAVPDCSQTPGWKSGTTITSIASAAGRP